MSESKVFMFPESNNIMSTLAPLLQLRGVDPNLLLMNLNGFGGNSWFIWIIFLWILTGYNGFGNRNGELSNMMNNNTGRELLMSYIQGNGNAINQLASTLNCSVGDILSAVNGVMSAVQGVGNLVGMSAQLIINAVQAGNCSIASKIADCCCENRLAICLQTNTLQNAINSVAVGLERGFSSVAYETLRLTCDILNTIKSATDSILAGLRDAEMREMQNKIDALREANSLKDVIINNGQLTAIFNLMIQSATTPLVSAVNTLLGDINSIKCKLPETATVPYSPVVGVPTCVAAQYGLGFNSYTPGFWG